MTLSALEFHSNGKDFFINGAKKTRPFMRPVRPITIGRLERIRDTRLRRVGEYITKEMKQYGIMPGDTTYVYNMLQMDPD